jgi:hypothetical protein
MSANTRKADSNAEQKKTPRYQNIPLKPDTYARMTAFKHRNPLVNRSYDEALNEILDSMKFPQSEELQSPHLPIGLSELEEDSE